MTEIIHISELSRSPEYRDQLQDALDIFKWQLIEDDIIQSHDTVGALYNIITYQEHKNLNGLALEYSFRTWTHRWYLLFKDIDEFNQAMHELSPKRAYDWCQFAELPVSGYEVTSKGDRRFSPFFMKVNSGEDRLGLISLEDYYHLILKGYYNQGYRSWKEVKGKPPLDPTDFTYKVEIVYRGYLSRYLGLAYELALVGRTRYLTDMFDEYGGQNKIYCNILNSYYNLCVEDSN